MTDCPSNDGKNPDERSFEFKDNPNIWRSGNSSPEHRYLKSRKDEIIQLIKLFYFSAELNELPKQKNQVATKSNHVKDSPKILNFEVLYLILI